MPCGSIIIDGCFIDQHDGYAVLNGIYATALDAFEAVAVGSRLDLLFAQGTGEDFE